MKQFKFRSTEKAADNLLDVIELRAKKQSRFYRLAFIVFAFLATSYILNNLSIREYDGYISHKDITMRAVRNLAIVDYYVKPGDIVKEGDTLYSCLMSDWLEDKVNPFTIDAAEGKKIDCELRIAKYESEIVEINNNIYSLHSAISAIEEDIRSGIKTEDDLVNLNLELAERIERSEHIRRAIAAEHETMNKYGYSVGITKSLISQSLSERMANLRYFGEALKYRVAYVDSKIIDINAPYGMITFQGEPIMTFQPINHPDMTNTHIEMIVEADEYGDITDGMEVAVYAGGKFLCDANVSFLGVRMAGAYANMELLLDRSTDINGKLIISLDLKEDYKLPEKYYIHNYPVEIRHRQWGDLSNAFSWNHWFEGV